MIAQQIRQQINANVALTALGNSTRTLRDVAIDLIHASGWKYKVIAEETFLTPSTIKNLASGKTIRPQAETIERIFRAFEYQLDMKAVKLNAKYANRAKK
jgi:transcriptional regulator with XRE-family HTH domain